MQNIDSAPNSSTPSTSPDPLNVVIAFDDARADYRALQLLARTLGPARHEFDLRPLPWTFEALASPHWRRYASEDAARAVILVVATTRCCELPATVRDWIRTSFAWQRTVPSLLLALLGAPGETPEATQPARDFLRQTAEAAGLSFLAPDPSVPPEATLHSA